MIYNFNGKDIKISDAEIENNMKVLEISKEEAIQMYLEDEGYLLNEEQEKLEQKAKENRITATIHQASAKDKKDRPKRERPRKENPTKERVIADIAKMLSEYAENVNIENPGKIITFSIDSQPYKIDLTATRVKKK